MSKTVSFDYSKAGKFLGADELQNFKTITLNARDTLLSKTGAGNDFLGWIDLPICYDKEEFERIKATAKKIKEDSDVLLVVGIGGSYLGARAAIEFLSHSFYNCLDKSQRNTPQIIFCGNSISSKYIADIKDLLKDKDFSINIQYRNERIPKWVSIIATSSALGDYFTGGTGSILYLDEFCFVYE